MLRCRIENNEVTITGVKYNSIKYIEIPKFIDGYPVTEIDPDCFYRVKIMNINGKYIIDGVNLINDNFIYYNKGGCDGYKLIFKIKYQISDDYTTMYGDDYCCYFIENNFYNPVFNK